MPSGDQAQPCRCWRRLSCTEGLAMLTETKNIKIKKISEDCSKMKKEEKYENEDKHEENKVEEEENKKKVHESLNRETVQSAAWTPIRVRKARLGGDRNLGLSPKSLTKLKVENNGNSREKLKLKSGNVRGLTLLFEGAFTIQTKADSLPNPCNINPTAAQD